MGQLMSSGPPLPLKEWKPHTPERGEGFIRTQLIPHLNKQGLGRCSRTLSILDVQMISSLGHTQSQ